MVSKMSRKFVQRMDGTCVTSGPQVQTSIEYAAVVSKNPNPKS